ncbi:MAG TPA: cyclic nucleotide-binding domain-containing protein [Gammaproteobacteria bacterium]|nr:cyclic nucleotide-binding domain-containing protein [Gammaproteobacteria bacterium]
MLTTTLDSERLKGFSPLSGLKPEHLTNLASKIAVQKLDAGHYLFKQKDTGRFNVYLLSGSVELRSGDQVLTTIKSGSDEARHPLAPQIPRHLSARAATGIEYIQIDSDFLDIMLTWDQSGAFEVGELQAQESQEHDWMTAVLQVKAFHRIPPANIQTLFMRMEHVSCKQGAVIIKQGDIGDFFYVLTQGRCLVTREAPNNKKVIQLAELSVGASFGEDALLADSQRNASVTMLTDGALVRLAKEDFKALLIEPQQQRIGLEEAKEIVGAGGQWLDVRLPSEFENQHPAGALNFPLYFIRMKLDSLDPKRKYVVCCDTGRRSSAGAFILSERGFDAYILKNGLSDYASY